MTDPVPTLQIILDWYAWLPKGAREKLSLYHLHTLSKNLNSAAGQAPKDHHLCK